MAATHLHAATTAYVERALRSRWLAYALVAQPCGPEIAQARLTYRHAVSEQSMLIVRASQESGDVRQDIAPDTAATVIVGSFMEGLIDPLSPLSADFGSAGNHDHAAVGAQTESIAEPCCAAISAP